MSLYMAVVLIICMVAGTIILYRDIMSPAFLMLLVWFFSFFMLIGSELYYSEKSGAYIYVICGLLTFQLTYGLTFFSKSRKKVLREREKYSKIYHTMKLNKVIMWFVICFETLTMILYYIKLAGGAEAIGIFEYIHKMVFAVFYILILHACTCGKDEKKRVQFFLVVQCIPLVFALMLPTNGRASYFVFILGALFIYLTFHSYNTLVILKYFLLVVAVFIVLFIYVAIRKNHIAEGTTGIDLIVEAKEWLTHYLSGSLITFSRWLPNWKSDFSFGKNTFRIIYAVLERIGFNVDVSSTFFPFMQIGPNYYNIANVYTIFYTYIIDFGFFGGLLIEGILGVIYAKIYIKKDSHKIGDVYLYAVIMYALLMQCFGDQYVAITSYYMQMYLWYFLFYKCQLLFYRSSKGLVIVNY